MCSFPKLQNKATYINKSKYSVIEQKFYSLFTELWYKKFNKKSFEIQKYNYYIKINK